MIEQFRTAVVEVDLDAIRNNVSLLTKMVAPAEVCAVVKADGYGHGAVQVARAAVDGGATCLAVALVEEGQQLREAGIQVPILVLSEPGLEAMAAVVRYHLTPTLYTLAGVERFSDAVVESAGEAFPVHVKVDTGMHRVGVGTDDAVALMEVIKGSDRLYVEGLFTHFAVADESGPFTEEQASRFEEVVKRAADAGITPPLLHCSNSAATFNYPDLRMSMVRCGIAIYGLPFALDVPLPSTFQTALSVKGQISYVKRVEAGEAVSYGQRYRLERPSWIATVPIGYADGIPRSLAAAGGEVLIGGLRRPIAGTVTMDQITVDCGDEEVNPGDEVVLIGRQGDNEITAAEWAEKTGTIAYEIVCRIGPRLPRQYDAER